MKIVQINTVCAQGSTGKICLDVSKLLSEKGIENYICYASGKSDYAKGIKYMSDVDIKLQALKSRLFGNYGFNSKAATKKLIKKLAAIGPDIIHLHNLHGHNVHLGVLFDYLKQNNIKVYWTFHDCWTLTGYCPHYDMIGCDQWKSGCKKCPQRKRFSWFFDRSSSLYEKKKKLFTGLDLTIITPSKWMSDQVKQSFLKDNDIRVINNGIDLSVFTPTDGDFRKKYGLEDKHIVLGVAFGWGVRKGLDVFLDLAKRLDDRFSIVLVGTNSEIDKLLPDNIISIHRTNDQKELAEIYTAADVFVNPTRQETLGLTNIEALACGTPVITFNTGGSPECVDENSGIIVDRDDEKALYNAIIDIAENHMFKAENCIKKAYHFDQHQKYNEYYSLYKSLI